MDNLSFRLGIVSVALSSSPIQARPEDHLNKILEHLKSGKNRIGNYIMNLPKSKKDKNSNYELMEYQVFFENQNMVLSMMKPKVSDAWQVLGLRFL